MNQCEKILKYMEKYGSISNKEAVLDLNIMRLASRIHDLHRDGYRIKRENIKQKKNGEYSHYTRYSLIQEGES